MKERPLYEHRLADVLWHIEDARQRGLGRYKRTVVKTGKRKKKRKNGRPMTRAAMFAGWNEAAAAFARKYPVRVVRRPSITPEEWAEIDDNVRARAQRTLNKPLHPVDDLRGAEFGLLLVWKLSANTTHEIKRWWCLCACGKSCERSAGGLLNGRYKDCGHRQRDKKRQQHKRKRQRLARLGRKRAPWNMFKYRANKLKKGVT